MFIVYLGDNIILQGFFMNGFENRIKLVTIDFDGTSLQRDKIWMSYRNMHAIRECRKKGVVFVPCTGRSQNMFPPQVENDPAFRYWVTSMGSRVVDSVTGEVLYNKTFTVEESAELCRLYEGRHIYSEIAADGKLYFEQDVLDELWKYPVPPHHVWYLESGRAIGVKGKLSDFFLANNIAIEKFNLYGCAPEFQAELRAELKKRPYAVFKDKPGVDLQFYNAYADRVAAVETVLSRLGLTFDSVMSIGDEMGMDSAMIERAALGVAMGNGDEELKAMADYVTDSFEQDGFGKALEKWLLD